MAPSVKTMLALRTMRIFAAKMLSPSAIQSSGWVRRPLRPRLRWDWPSRNLFSSLWNERFEQRLEARTQVQLLALLFEELARVGCGLERVPQVRQPHEPERMAQVFFTAHLKCDPA